MVPLICLDYFSKHHHHEFKYIISNNKSEENESTFPIAKAAVEIVNIFELELLGPLTKWSYSHTSIVLSHDYILEELFGVTMKLFFEIWQAVDASKTDFKKSAKIVKELIKSVLLRDEVESLEGFKLQFKIENINEYLESYWEECDFQRRQMVLQNDENQTIKNVWNHIEQYTVEEAIIKQMRLLESPTCFTSFKQNDSIYENMYIKFDKIMKGIIYSNDKSKLNDPRKCKLIKILHIENIIEPVAIIGSRKIDMSTSRIQKLVS